MPTGPLRGGWLRLATPFYFKVKRAFASIRSWENKLWLNMIVFDMDTKSVEQINTAMHNQEATFTDIRYDAAKHHLMFVVGGKLEVLESEIYEISEETLAVILREDNWARLTKGLNARSDKTIQWCHKRGIY